MKRVPIETIYCLLFALVLFGVTEDARAAVALAIAALAIPLIVAMASSDTSRVRLSLGIACAALLLLGFEGMLVGFLLLHITAAIYLTLLIFHTANERTRWIRISTTLFLSVVPLYFSADGGGRPFLTVPAGTVLVILSWLSPHMTLRPTRRMTLAATALLLVGLISTSVVLSKGAAAATIKGIWYAQENWGWGGDSGETRIQRQHRALANRSLNLQPPKDGGKRTIHAFVELKSALPTQSHSIYLREAAYESFNGRMWLSLGGDYKTHQDGEKGDAADGWVVVARPQTESMCRYHVYVPKIRSRQVLCMPGTVCIGVPVLLEGQNASYRLPQSGFESFSYPVVSAPAFFHDIVTRSPKIGRAPKAFRQLPATELVRRIRDETRASVAAISDPILRIKQIVGALRVRCTYERTPRNIPGRNLENFLYGDRRGHCSLFATACALQLRAAGIPTRIAVGYLSGTMDPRNGVYVFTNKDRHAWVEVYMQDFGWVTLDPTPPRTVGSKDLVLTDFAEQKENFVELGKGRDAQVARQAPSLVSRIRDKTRAYGQSLLAVAGLLAALLVYAVYSRRNCESGTSRRRKRKRVWEGPDFYQALCRYYAACGCPRAKGQTPREYLRRLQRRGLANGELNEMIDYYYGIRYEGAERLHEREAEYMAQVEAMPKPVRQV